MQPIKLQESFETASTHDKPIIVAEIECRSIKQAKAYEKKKTFYSSQIPNKEIHPMQKLWVLNTRFKSIRRVRKSRWKESYLLTKIHSHGRVDIKASTNEFSSC